MEYSENKSLNFIEEIVEEDLRNGKNDARFIHVFLLSPTVTSTSVMPRPFASSFGIARKYNGKCNLRFDDTNPVTEDVEYVDAIKEDIQWLGFSGPEKPIMHRIISTSFLNGL